MPESPVLGYVKIDGEGDGFRGALLVVDSRGIPLDFRYTDLVSPTKLERVLYGDALELYIREEVILGSLLGAVEKKPDLWVCGDRHLMGPVFRKVRQPAVTLESTDRPSLEEPGKFIPLPEDGSYLLQAALLGSPLRISVLSGADMVKVASLLSQSGKTMDVLEPFIRIDKALESLD